MSPNTPSSPSFQIRQVFKSSLVLLAKNILLLLLLVFLTDIILYLFLTNLFEGIEDLRVVKLVKIGLNKINGWIPANDSGDEAYEGLFEHVLYPFLYGLILTIITSKLIYNVLQDGRTRIHLKDMIAYYKNPDFWDVLRCGSIIVCLYVVVFASSFFAALMFGVGWKLGSVMPTLAFCLIFGSISMLLFLSFIMARWSVVIPVTVVEKTNVRASFKRSWSLTAVCWKKVLAVEFLTLMFLSLGILPWLGILFWYANLENFEGGFLGELFTYLNHIYYTGLLGLAESVVPSVCYYYVRKAEDEHSTEEEPEPLSS